ncbi:Outer membrane protein TolC [Tistlia consotensis]|uniref:Outer membrane protein TolC n=1 Tax=Tistlia consotensis USBA 355 TaxID=560819 RepID=A0A1Y6BMW5_9PROT|nr:TolC family protein [Tistlia consotensis]SMF20513.1 Outer membrane protein TolC [Tistlia consotensis USBA 355]SNR47828.1 Outer membrane protein TolC [Tistlia consotensis]
MSSLSTWSRVGGRLAAAAVVPLVLASCAIQPDPYTTKELQQKAVEQYKTLYSKQEPIKGPVGLYEAMARAVRYNLDQRVKVMEEAFSQRQLDVARFDLLPQINAGGAASHRNNVNASSSRSVITGQESLEPSTSQDQNSYTADLNVVWNVLDFGIGYFAANQQADRALVAYEQRRRIIQQIVQDVRSAYWRAVAGQRLLDQVDPLLRKVAAARADSRRIEQLRLRSPLEALTYQRTLLDTQRQLNDLRRELLLAKAQLATLMNLPPDQDFQVVMPDDSDFPVPKIELSPDQLEMLALTYRPELHEDIYQSRISRDETRKAMLRLLPGIEFNTSLNYDSNSFLVNQSWYEYGARISWNLLNLINGPARIELAETQEDLVKAKRRATAAAVVTQAHVSWISFHEARDDFSNAADLVKIDGRILDQFKAGGRADRFGQLPIIQSELNLLLSQLRRDLAYARLQSASGQILLSIGADPLPDQIADGSLDTLAAAIRDTEHRWEKGDFVMAAELPPGAGDGQAAMPEAAAEPVVGPVPVAEAVEMPRRPGERVEVQAAAADLPRQAGEGTASSSSTTSASAPAAQPLVKPSVTKPALNKPEITHPATPAAPSMPKLGLAPAGSARQATTMMQPPSAPSQAIAPIAPGPQPSAITAPSPAEIAEPQPVAAQDTPADQQQKVVPQPTSSGSLMQRFFSSLKPAS